MGVSFLSLSKCKCEECKPKPSQEVDTKTGNPNPYNFRIIKSKNVGTFCVAEVEYPDCKNYEGKKILVIKDMTSAKLSKLKLLDPHFCDKYSEVNIVARIKPSYGGFTIGVALAKMLNF